MKQMVNGIKIHQTGGPEVLNLESHELSQLQDDEVLIRHYAIGVNFIDTYYRTGLYQVPLPSGIGSEAAGVIEEIGRHVTHLKVGDRVAYATGPIGSYAEKRIIDSKFVVKIPPEVSFEQAASVLLKGLTVQYLFKSVSPLKSGEIFLFHAAAGGVGLIACQWAMHLGAKLIGTVSSDEKAELAKQSGAWETINYNQENVPEKVKKLTHGNKVSVVFDSIGKSTWEASLDCLAPKGLMVSFGNASGPVNGVSLSTLAQKGSLFVTRPILAHYVPTHEDLNLAAQDLFDLVSRKIINPEMPQRFELNNAKEAHLELANRKRTGPIILIP